MGTGHRKIVTGNVGHKTKKIDKSKVGHKTKKDRHE